MGYPTGLRYYGNILADLDERGQEINCEVVVPAVRNR